MLEDVQRDEGRPAGAPRRVIVSGSRQWGTDRLGSQPEWRDHEAEVLAKVIARLIARYVIGLSGDPSKRDRSAIPGPGLVIIQGDQRGLDTQAADVTRIYATGLRRRGAGELRTTWIEPELADGLWLETYPADWTHFGKAAGGLRNQQMLDTGADQVIAFYAHGRAYGPSVSGGTNDMVRRAVAAGIPVDAYIADERRWRKP